MSIEKHRDLKALRQKYTTNFDTAYELLYGGSNERKTTAKATSIEPIVRKEKGKCRECGQDHSFKPNFEGVKTSIDIIPEMLPDNH